jgi:hypothetical protein
MFCSYLKTLKTLIMKQNRNHEITDEGAKHLARLKNIDSLDVANTGITDQGRHSAPAHVWSKCVYMGVNLTLKSCSSLLISVPLFGCPFPILSDEKGTVVHRATAGSHMILLVVFLNLKVTLLNLSR